MYRVGSSRASTWLIEALAKGDFNARNLRAAGLPPLELALVLGVGTYRRAAVPVNSKILTLRHDFVAMRSHVHGLRTLIHVRMQKIATMIVSTFSLIGHRAEGSRVPAD